jgi:hypothetical protein
MDRSVYAKHIPRNNWYWYLHYIYRRNFVIKSAYDHGQPVEMVFVISAHNLIKECIFLLLAFYV